MFKALNVIILPFLLLIMFSSCSSSGITEKGARAEITKLFPASLIDDHTVVEGDNIKLEWRTGLIEVSNVQRQINLNFQYDCSNVPHGDFTNIPVAFTYNQINGEWKLNDIKIDRRGSNSTACNNAWKIWWKKFWANYESIYDNKG